VVVAVVCEGALIVTTPRIVAVGASHPYGITCSVSACAAAVAAVGW
jgi:hypothetical protein